MDMVCKGDANFFTIHTFFQFNVEFTFFFQICRIGFDITEIKEKQ